MSRYIDADKLVEQMLKRYQALVDEYGDYDHYTTGYDDAIDEIEVFPTADVVEVRHGHWKNENQRPKTSKFICSVCGGLAYYVQPNRDMTHRKHCPYKHCPNCGAKMAIERKEEK